MIGLSSRKPAPFKPDGVALLATRQKWKLCHDGKSVGDRESAHELQKTVGLAFV